MSLGRPRFDPHGDPIPSRGGVIQQLAETLSEFPKDANVRIESIVDQDKEFLRFARKRTWCRADYSKSSERKIVQMLSHLKTSKEKWLIWVSGPPKRCWPCHMNHKIGKTSQKNVCSLV